MTGKLGTCDTKSDKLVDQASKSCHCTGNLLKKDVVYGRTSWSWSVPGAIKLVKTAENSAVVQAFLADVLGMRYKEDLRTLLFCCGYFALVYAQLKFDFDALGPLWIAMFMLSSFSSFQGAVSVHNAVHAPLFYSQWKNKVFQCIISIWFGHCASSYIPGHNLSHHRNLQTRKDVMRTTKMRFRLNFLNGLLFMPTILSSTSSNDARYFQVQKTFKRPIFYQLRLEALVYVTFNVAIAAHSPKKWFWVIWLPCLVGKYMIISLNMLQHDGCDSESKYNHSRNFTDPLLNYLCFNNGYHGIHHMYPGRHWSLLATDHAVRVEPFVHPNLDQKSIWGYIFRQFVYPGLRLDFNGNEIKAIDDGPDQPWFYATTESYSDRDVDTRAWTNGLSQSGPNGETMSRLTERSAKSYSLMK